MIIIYINELFDIFKIFVFLQYICDDNVWEVE